jgi:hypothetical protein
MRSSRYAQKFSIISVMDGIEELLTFLRDPSSGTRLSQNEYTRDFGDRLWLAGETDTWKLERMQFYDETGFPSWDAFVAGSWDHSQELYEAMRPKLRSFFLKYEEQGSRFCRIRIVETPLTPYLQWEMHCLRVRAQCGEHIRVVPARRLSGLEPLGRPVPELVSLRGATLYATEYDNAAKPNGGRRFTDRRVITSYESFASELFSSGEDLLAYFAREVAPLPPPRLSRSRSRLGVPGTEGKCDDGDQEPEGAEG